MEQWGQAHAARTPHAPHTSDEHARAAGVSFDEVVAWDWWRARPDNDLLWRRRGAWDANDLDTLAIVSWEIERRALGVSVADACALLAITARDR